MIVCFKCDTETKAKMDSMLANDAYKDYSELIAVAISNLFILGQEVSRKGALVFDDEPTSFQPKDSSQSFKKSTRSSIPTLQASLSQEKEKTDMGKSTIQDEAPHIPEIFSNKGLDDLTINTSDIHYEESADTRFHTLDRWIFGQYNKLLPIKANCRALARLLANHNSGVPLKTAYSYIDKEAEVLGNYLSDYDNKHKIKRDEALATAFPSSGLDSDKSRARYLNHFLGNVNGQGVLSGLLWEYRLVTLISGDLSRLQLTTQGFRFAQLINPVLDQIQDEPNQKFSSEEIGYLLNHIKTFISAENFAFQTLLKAIHQGADTPDTLDESLRFLIPTDSDRSLSSSFLTSQRSGALSRMTDLSLVERYRKGVRVTYLITELGKDYIGVK